MAEVQAQSRLDRRKARTRAALVAAGRELLATRDPAEVSIQEITDLADVGFGSFYNHFDSKQELFDVAIDEVMEEFGALLDEVTADIDDPAEVFATSLRLTARFPKTHPQLARIMARTGIRYLTTPIGLAPRALRDLQRAKAAGRASFDDPNVLLACVGGSLIGALNLGLTVGKPSAIDRVADGLAINMLRMLGLPDKEARRIAVRPLPKVLPGR